MSGSTDTGRTIVALWQKPGGKSERLFRVGCREARRRQRAPEGFTSPAPFSDVEAIRAYLALDPLPCLLCGREMKNLGTHLKAHAVSAAEYKERFRLPLGTGLVTPACSRALSEAQLKVEHDNPAIFTLRREMHKKSPQIGTQWGRDSYAHLRAKSRRTIAARECAECGRVFRPPHFGKKSPRHGTFCSRRCRARQPAAREAHRLAEVVECVRNGIATSVTIAAAIGISVNNANEVIKQGQRKGILRRVPCVREGRNGVKWRCELTGVTP